MWTLGDGDIDSFSLELGLTPGSIGDLIDNPGSWNVGLVHIGFRQDNKKNINAYWYF